MISGLLKHIKEINFDQYSKKKFYTKTSPAFLIPLAKLVTF